MKTWQILGVCTALSSGIVAPAIARSTTDQPRESISASNVTAVADTGDILVTARKRSERLLDVPVSVTEIDASALLDQNLNTIRDFYSRVPGLSYTGGTAETTLAIRGVIADETGNPTVAVTIDDVPFGPSSSNAHGGQLNPDLDPAILKGIEVLRGPQGTLYGASSLGGLL